MNDIGKIFRLKQILELKVPEPSYLWGEFITKNEINVVIGMPNAGKSPIIIAYMLNSIHENSFLGRKTQGENILFIDEESSLSVLTSRMKRFIMSISNKEPKHNLHIFWSRSFKIIPTDLVKLKEYCKEHEIQTVIIDAAARVFTGKENESDYITQIFSMLKPLCDELGLTFIFIHHTVKTTKSLKMADLRGSGDFAAMAGSIIGLRSRPNDLIEIKHLKNRHGKLSDSILCKIIDTTTPTGKGLDVELVGEVKNEINFDKLILNWIEKNISQGIIFKSGLIYNQFPHIKQNQIRDSLNNLASDKKLLGAGLGKWVLNKREVK